MSEPVFREFQPSDVPALTALWSDVFGDGTGSVSCFFRVLPEIGTCFAADCGGRIIGMTSVLTDLRYTAGDSSVKCAYIYAVAVDPSFRGAGIGGKLSRMAAGYGREHGAEIIATLPADDGLYSMYEKTLGMKNTLSRKKITAEAAASAEYRFSLRPAPARDYNRKREGLLASTPHISVSDGSMEFLKALCMENGGDLYVSEGCCAACYVNQKELFFPELLCPEEQRNGLLAEAAARKGLSGAYCYLPSTNGLKSLAFTGIRPDPATVWNITFE